MAKHIENDTSKPLLDTYRQQGLRKRLVNDLRQRGIGDETVLAAMQTVPRHFFFDKSFEEHAYEDRAFAIGFEQTISQPYIVAYQTLLLRVQKGHRILEIGTGSGYQAAILAALGAEVYTLERQEGLYVRTKALLARLGISTIHCYLRDGTVGLPEKAPFDGIIVTAATAEVPDALRRQLAVGGRLIVPVGKEEQFMQSIQRTSHDTWRTDILEGCRFVPFLQGIAPYKTPRR